MTGRTEEFSRRDALRVAGVAGTGALAGLGAFGHSTTGQSGPGTATTGTNATAGGPTTANASEVGTTTGTPTTTTPIDRSRFETVVNVAEAGADSSGEESVNAVLDENLGDDILLYFPPGRYRLDPWQVTGYRNLGVVGEDAALVPPDGLRGYWLMWGDLQDFAFSGFDLDCRAERTAPVNYLSVSGGTNVVRDVAIRGHRRAPTNGFEIAAADPKADLRFENVALPDGSTRGHAVYVFPTSVGKLTVRNCRVEDWREGLYAAYHSGPLRILGGYYANNGNEQIRVGGGTAGAVVRNVTVRVDDPKESSYKPNMRGIWAEEGGHVRIENCDVAVSDLTGNYSSGAIVVGKQFGEAVVTNTRIRIDVDAPVPGLLVRKPITSLAGQTVPSMDSLPERRRVVARNVRITGTAPGGAAIRTNRREDCLFENVCISHPEGDRHGVWVDHAAGCAVRNATIDVSGEPVRAEATTVATTDLRTDGPCHWS